MFFQKAIAATVVYGLAFCSAQSLRRWQSLVIARYPIGEA